MNRLSEKNLPENIQKFSYDRAAVNIGIVHFGIGNFHRAHQALYVEELLEQGDTQWGIVGISMRSSAMKEALAPQDYLYTLATLGTETDYRIIGAVKDIIVAPEAPQTVIDLMAKPTTQLVSSTITEKGYYLASGDVDFDHPSLRSEVDSLATPKTIYGFIAAGLMARCKAAPTSKLTIMCCDNISSGGELIEVGVRYLLERHDKAVLTWLETHVNFISSMVDRVCPATDDRLKAAVLRDTGCRDASPVSAEPFRQWVIEDRFAGERPDFDHVGAVLVDDIAPFERMKLSYLNGAHTMVSCLGYLSGDVYVHEALLRPDLFNFMRRALYENVLPHAAVPAQYDGAIYIEDVIKRFQNSHLPYGNLQVGTDSSQKIQQRWFPTLEAALEAGADCSFFAFSLAAWVIFIQTALSNGVLNDPKKGEFEKVQTKDLEAKVKLYLAIANGEKYDFYKTPKFMQVIVRYAQDIDHKGLERALKDFLIVSEL